MERIISAVDADGVFIGEDIARLSPLEDGVYLIPSGAVDLPPPILEVGKQFRLVGGEWFKEDAAIPPVESPPSIDDLRSYLNQQVSLWRDSQEAAGVKFEYKGHTYDGGDKSRLRLQDSVASGIAASGQFFWTDEANEDVPMDTETLAGLYGSMMSARVEQGFRIHVRQRQMKEEIAVLDVDELQAYQVGWPAPPAEPVDPDQPA